MPGRVWCLLAPRVAVDAYRRQKRRVRIVDDPGTSKERPQVSSGVHSSPGVEAVRANRRRGSRAVYRQLLHFGLV